MNSTRTLRLRSIPMTALATAAVMALGCGGAPAPGDEGEDVAAAPEAAVAGLRKSAPLAAGGAHGCAITMNGAVKCWGENTRGQLGDGSTSTSTLPVNVKDLTDVVFVSAGNEHSCAVTSAGTVYCWGKNSNGQLGDGTTKDRATPVQVNTLTTAVAVSAGFDHTCALLSSGSIWCWGENKDGQLGVGDNEPRSWPTEVPNPSQWYFTAVAAGTNHTCGLLSDGTVLCWGYNGRGALGTGFTSTGSNLPVAVVKLDGVTSIAAGNFHSCAARVTGEVLCWGSNFFGELGHAGISTDINDPQSHGATPVTVDKVTGVVEVSAESNFTVARNALGQTWRWGGDWGAPQFAGGDLDLGATSIVAGGSFACAAHGSCLHCFGVNTTGQLGDGQYNTLVPTYSATSTVGGNCSSATLMAESLRSVALGEQHGCAMSRDGGAYCWGRNNWGQLGTGDLNRRTTPVSIGDTVTQIVAGAYHTCALSPWGVAHCWGYNGSGQLGDGNSATWSTSFVGVSGIDVNHPAIALAAGAYHTCALMPNGSVRCWGHNGYGQIGDGTTDMRTTPVEVLSGGVISIAAGDFHTCAAQVNGSVLCWGRNAEGQLGNGSYSDAYKPTPAGQLTYAVAVVAGTDHTCALFDDGTVPCWGGNSSGQLGYGAGSPSTWPEYADIDRVVSLAAGKYFNCATIVDGTVKCWGSNAYGQLGSGAVGGSSETPKLVSGLSDAVGIDAGGAHACAVLANGDLRCWGRGDQGQLGDGKLKTEPVPTIPLKL